MLKKLTSLRFAALLLSLIGLSSPLQAQINGSWIGTSTGTTAYWSNTANWFSGTVAGGAGSTVDFTRDVVATTSINVDGTRTVGTLNIGDSSNQYVVGGTLSPSLVFNSGGTAAAQLNYVASSTTVQFQSSLPISLLSSLVISNAGQSQTIASNISAGSAGLKTISVSSGSVAFSGSLTNGAGTLGISMTNPTGVLSITGNLTQTMSGTVDLSAGRLRFAGNVSNGLGTGTLFMNGGTISTVLTTARTISNYTIWNSATSTIGDVANGDTGVLTFSSSQTLTGNRTFNVVTTGTSVLGSGTNIIGDGGNGYSLTKIGAGALRITGTTTYTGGTVINEGTLALGANARLLDTGTVTVNNGSTFDLGIYSDAIATLVLNNGTVAGTQVTGLTANFNVFEGLVSSNLAGNSSVLTKSGTGTVTLSASNSYRGGTIINQGTLALSGSGRLADLGNVTVSGGTLDLGGNTDTVAAVVIGSGTITNGTLVGTSYSGTAGTVNAVLSGGGSLAKNGEGSLVLNGTNTYTGSTAVNAGTLVVNGEIAASSTVTVASTATLKGKGRINGAVSVLNGGTLAPGESPGVLEVGTLNLAAGSTTNMEISGTVRDTQYDGFDILTASGLTYGGNLVIDFSSISAIPGEYDLFNFTGTDSGTWGAITIAGFYTAILTNDGSGVWTGADDATVFTFTEATGDLEVIPEPSTWALLLGGLVFVAIVRRRKAAQA